jgi:hypothetical protein
VTQLLEENKRTAGVMSNMENLKLPKKRSQIT